ncbi:MAG: hypothetical protein DWQ53_14145 [Microcystis flos-aquae DF17]|nr:MAG: hypothetical protein DWQ53_14145 [Microcystis flos-aquae DF17]
MLSRQGSLCARARLDVDILAAVKRTAIPKPHDLGFCLGSRRIFRTCLNRFTLFWSYGRSTD